MASRGYAKKAPAATLKNASASKPPKAAAAKRAAPKRQAKAKATIARESDAKSTDILSNILERVRSNPPVPDAKVGASVPTSLILIQPTPALQHAPQPDLEAKRARCIFSSLTSTWTDDHTASEPGDGGLPTVLPVFVISDYHSYILPGLNRHVEATSFQQAGLKLDKARYIAIFLEKKVRVSARGPVLK